MIRGGDFYAIWLEERGLWSTDEQDALQLIDHELDLYYEKNKSNFEANVKVMHLWDSESGMIDNWHKYCQKQMRDSFHMLDEKLIFSNTGTNKKDYASKVLPYNLEEGPCEAYDKLMSVLYSRDERMKIEWAIGSIVSGDSKKLQKFMVLYGAAGTGKSTVLNIIQQLFEGYYSVFDAKALGSSNNSFALEAFKTNPLVAIQHDGDLSRIEDNTRLNSLVSHEMMTVNEKFKSTYASRFKCFLFMGTNKPVKITDAKSGLIRRLIDVSPTGNKVGLREYKQLTKQVSFELGAIAWHCKRVYEENPDRYDNYIPITMLGASNDFYNFILDSYYVFKKQNGTTLKAAWEMYRTYCDDAKVPYPLPQRLFKEELKNYFEDYKERCLLDDGTRVRSIYQGFRTDKIEEVKIDNDEPTRYIIDFKAQKSIFDTVCATCPAQYSNENGTPLQKWSSVTTTLADLDTSKLHYVKVPENHIVIDFDIKDENGEKSYEKNLEEASKWPKTYAELSKSGAGIHLHYIYSGDVTKLQRVYAENIEIKVFTGNSSLRRMLTKCNNLDISTISSGLPLKGETKVVNFDRVKSEKGLRNQIEKNLRKEVHAGTKPSIDFIYKILEDAYESGLRYDVSDMRKDITTFASNSTHQADYCLKLVNKMKFKSEEQLEPAKDKKGTEDIVFFDIEVFPNLFLVNWKKAGKNKHVIRMINPTPSEIEKLISYKLIGFNCRRYDNHILYGALMGYTNQQLYSLSQRIINNTKNAMFGEAYNISYADVYDFASAGNKQSLKKFEIKLGIHHQELGLPWDKPVPEELWPKVSEYCDNDVIATEAVFNYLSADWTARQILADLAGMPVNSTTNSLTARIIFGPERHPQSQFNYRNLAEPVKELDEDIMAFLKEACPEMMAKRHGPAKSLLPYFEGYTYDHGISTYRGVEVGEGGRVYAEPGMYVDVALLDIASMHPHSAIAEVLFGAEFTARFREIVEGRVSIKHKAWDEVNKMLNGKLTPYIQKVIDGEMTAKDLANALKTAINSVYGLTAANFDNEFRDIRNIDNIVAKRGALFMVDLQLAVQAKGFKVAHIKTDSIKIPNATPEIIQFVMDFGKRYGYTFEHEATYDRMCLVNDAVYIAKYKDGAHEFELPTGEVIKTEWTATGAQFQIPYVFKTLFSHTPIEFQDLCVTNQVSTAMYLNTTGEEKPNLFVGKVGQFCPIKADAGGGDLVSERTDKDGNVKYVSVTGAKGFKWLESEAVKVLGKESDIDRSYFDNQVTDAVNTISKFGDFEWFSSDENPKTIYDQPPWLMACGKESCINCPNFHRDAMHMDCNLGYDISDFVAMNAEKITELQKQKP